MTAVLHMIGRGRHAPPPFIAEDPRFLLLAFVTLIAMPFVIARPAGLVLLLAYIIVLLFTTGIPPRALALHARTVSIFVALIIVINAIFVDGRPLPTPFSVLSLDGLVAGCYYSLRVLVLYSAVVFLLAATPPESVAAGVASLMKRFAPQLARRLALHTFVSMGFLPLFADEIGRIRAAQSFRGGWGTGGPLRRISSLRLIVVPLVLSAVHRSAQLAMAVEVRRISETIDRILVIGGPTLKDVTFSLVTVVVLVAAVVV